MFDNANFEDDKHYVFFPPCSSTSSFGSSELDRSLSPVDIKPTINNELLTKFNKTKVIDTVKPSQCAVCGGWTKCCHYDVPSCYGCKTFFRRSILARKNYHCLNHGKCDVKLDNRCRSCRFRQCILAGMNPAGVKLPEDVNFNDVVDYIESRKRGAKVETIFMDESIVPTKIALPMGGSTLIEFRDVDYMLFLEMKVRNLRESSHTPDFLNTIKLKDLICTDTALRTPANHNPATFMKSKNDFLQRLTTTDNPLKREWFARDLFLSIEMAKALPLFEEFNLADKEAYLRNAALTIALLTQCYYSHEKHSDTVIYPDGFVPLWLSTTSELTNIETEIFVRIVQPVRRINITKEEYALLKAIIFCNPAVNNFSEAGRRLLEQESRRYSRSLLRYVQSVHGAARGASRFAQIIAIMEAMIHFGQRNREFHVMLELNLNEWKTLHNVKHQLPLLVSDIMET